MQKTLAHLFLPRKTNNHRSWVLHGEGIALFTGIVVVAQLWISVFSVPTGPLPAVLGFSSSITSSSVVATTNAKRVEAGLGNLTVQPELSAAAVAKGKHMCAEQYWSHISPKGVTPWVFIKDSGYRYSVAGENLARDFSDTDSMVSAWMASPTHKANIMNTRYKDIGIGVVDCKLLGTDTTLVVQMFGSALVPSAKNTAKKPAVTAPPQVKAEMTEITDQERAEVAGEESAPAFIAAANPALSLATPAPISESPELFTPLQVTKAISIAILITLLLVLFVDMWVTHQKKVVRIAGRNLGHMLFLFGILVVVIFLKSGLTL